MASERVESVCRRGKAVEAEAVQPTTTRARSAPSRSGGDYRQTEGQCRAALTTYAGLLASACSVPSLLQAAPTSDRPETLYPSGRWLRGGFTTDARAALDAPGTVDPGCELRKADVLGIAQGTRLEPYCR